VNYPPTSHAQETNLPLLHQIRRHSKRKTKFGENKLMKYLKVGKDEELMTLPKSTFGYIYVNHMISNGLGVDFFDKVDSFDLLTYYANRVRSTHDMSNILLN
jgi:ubiquinone biosynthesis protein Coq4